MTWFPLDFVTLIPFDIMSLTWNASNLKEQALSSLVGI